MRVSTGHVLVVKKFYEKGRQLVSKLKELNSAESKILQLPVPKKPQNQYYMELLMLRDLESRKALLGKDLHLFGTADSI